MAKAGVTLPPGFELVPVYEPPPGFKLVESEGMLSAAQRGAGTGLARDVGGLFNRAAGLLSMPSAAMSAALGGGDDQLEQAAGQFAAPQQAALQQAQAAGLDTSVPPAGTAARAAYTFGEVAAPNLAIGLVSGGINPGTLAGEILAAVGGGAGASAGEAIGGDTGRAIGGIAGTLASPAIGATMRTAFRGTSPQATQQARQAFEAFGASPPASVGGSWGSKLIDNITGGLLGGSSIQHRRNVSILSKLQGRIDEVADSLGRVDDQVRMGQVIERGLTSFEERFRSTANALYGKSRAMTRGVQVAPRETQRLLTELTQANPQLKGTIGLIQSKLVQQLGASFRGEVDAASGLLDFEAMSAFRSAIGDILTDPRAVDNVPMASLKRLWGAVTDDLTSAAAQHSPQALAAHKRATAFYKGGIKRVEQHVRQVLSKGDPEKMFQAMNSAVKNSPSLLRRVRKSMTREEWSTFSGMILRRMGQPSASRETTDFMWSTETFLTNYTKMRRAGVAGILFDGLGAGKGVIGDLDKIAKVSDELRQIERTAFNPPGTAGRLSQQGQGLALSTALATPLAPQMWVVAAAGAASVAGSAGAQALIGSPRFVRWLSRSTSLPAGQLANHMRELPAIAEKEPQARELIRSVAEQLRF